MAEDTRTIMSITVDVEVLNDWTDSIYSGRDGGAGRLAVVEDRVRNMVAISAMGEAVRYIRDNGIRVVGVHVHPIVTTPKSALTGPGQTFPGPATADIDAHAPDLANTLTYDDFDAGMEDADLDPVLATDDIDAYADLVNYSDPANDEPGLGTDDDTGLYTPSVVDQEALRAAASRLDEEWIPEGSGFRGSVQEDDRPVSEDYPGAEG